MVLFGLVIAFAASVIGGICGIGGGVLMKPILDLTGIATASQASFLSSMTVLAMTSYNTGKNLIAKDDSIDCKTAVPLAIGASIGGVVGKMLFETVKSAFDSPNTVGAVQSVVLGILVLATLAYTMNKGHIKALHVTDAKLSLVIGLLLGLLSSFLGIGGGPFNLAFLFFFFSMPTKNAVQNSLFVILFSQIASLIYTIVSKNVPTVDIKVLVMMIIGGILGGIFGKRLGKKIDGKTTDILFIGLMVVIIVICGYNAYNYIAR